MDWPLIRLLASVEGMDLKDDTAPPALPVCAPGEPILTHADDAEPAARRAPRPN